MHKKEYFQCKFTVHEGTCIILSFSQMEESHFIPSHIPPSQGRTVYLGSQEKVELSTQAHEAGWTTSGCQHGKEKGDLWLHRNPDNSHKPGFSPCFAFSLKISHTSLTLCRAKKWLKPQSTIQSPHQHRAGSLFWSKCFLCMYLTWEYLQTLLIPFTGIQCSPTLFSIYSA